MAVIKRTGFGQVEFNHVSGYVEGHVYAQLPAAKDLGDILEQGRFAKYDYAKGKVDLEGVGPWLMIYNEEKHYDERKMMHKDYAMIRSDFNDGIMVPRLIEICVGDIFTTNTFGGPNTSDSAKMEEGVELVKGDFVKVDATGYLVAGEAEDGEPSFQVVKIYTMPDMQKGVKLQRVK